MVFTALAISMSVETMFGCGASLASLLSSSFLLEESLECASTCLEGWLLLPFLHAPPWFYKDPSPSWDSQNKLSRQWHNIMTSIIPDFLYCTLVSSPLSQPIKWHPPSKKITLVYLFVDIGMGLGAVLEASLTVQRYIYVDNGFVPMKISQHGDITYRG